MSYSVTLINKSDGSVEGHKAGCADIKRQGHNDHARFGDAWTLEVESKREAFLDYNADFLDEGQAEDEVYQIRWLHCADLIPNVGLVRDEPAMVEPVTATPTVKVGRKWTTITAADGSLIAEVRNDQVEAVLALLTR
jgi:hypothetical protein